MAETAMLTPDSRDGYSLPARLLHWLTAIIVIGLIPAGLYMVRANPGPFPDALYELHRSFGLLLLPIMLLRLTYRVAHPPPALPHDIPVIQRGLAHIVHGALYALLIVQPLVGWIATSAYRAPIEVFGLFELPPIWQQDRPFSETMFAVHKALGITIAILAFMHIGGALYHQFVRKDDVLMRMVRA